MPTPMRMTDEAVKIATGKTWPEWFAILDDAGSAHREHKAIAKWLADVHSVAPWWCQMVTVEYERARGLRQVHQTASGFEVSVHKTFEQPLHDVYVAWADDTKRALWLTVPREHLRSDEVISNTERDPSLGSIPSEISRHARNDQNSLEVKGAELVESMELTSTRLDKILHFKLPDPTSPKGYAGASGTKLDPTSPHGSDGASDTRIDVAIDASPSGKTRLGLAHTKLKNADDVETWRAFWKAALERLAKTLE